MRTAIICLLTVFSFSVNAQTSPTDAQGLTPNHSYLGSTIDHVDSYNGNVNLTIPLVSYPQVGGRLKFGFHISYNNLNWTSVPIANASGLPNQYWFQRNHGPTVVMDGLYALGINAVVQLAPGDPCANGECSGSPGDGGGGGGGGGDPFECDLGDDTCFVPPDTNFVPGGGARASSSSSQVSAQVTSPGCDSCYLPASYIYAAIDQDGAFHTFGQGSTTGIDYSMDGTGLAYNSSSKMIIDPSGTIYNTTYLNLNYLETNGLPGQLPNMSSILGTITDVNGNSIQRTTASWTDTTGRIIPMAPVPDNNDGTGLAYVPGVVNSDLSHCSQNPNLSLAYRADLPGPDITGISTYWFCFSKLTITSDFGVSGVQDRSYQELWLTSVTLPNGTQWVFHFATNGGLAKVDLPTGGSISYGYAPSLGYGSHLITSRTVNDGGGTPTSQQTWSYSNGSITNPDGTTETDSYDVSGGIAQSITSDANGMTIKKVNSLRSLEIQSPYQALGYEDFENPEITQTTSTIYQSAGQNAISSTTLYSFGSAFYQGSFYNPLLDAEGITPSTSTYNVYYGEDQREDQTNFYPATNQSIGPIYKSLVKTYLWQDPNAGPVYLSSNLLNTLSEIDTLDANGVPVAKTKIGYDEGNGSPQGAFGNVTSTSQWTGSAWNPSSSTVYGTNGMPVSIFDPNQNQTYTTYICGGSLPQTVTKAYASTTTLPETTNYSFNCASGTLATIQTPNDALAGRPGAAYKLDNMWNLVEIDYQDGGSELYDHHGYANPPQITETKLASPNPSVVITTSYDGLGRKRHTSLDTASPTPIYSDTGYDSMGRVNSVSNAYLTTTDATYGLTNSFYDSLGRIVAKIAPDNSKQLWCYDGTPSASYPNNCVGATAGVSGGTWIVNTDEVGNQWVHSMDGFGRLVGVTEPTGALTSYFYNTLGDLLNVEQYGLSASNEAPRQRSFSYDSMSRLITSKNPETGTICYGTVPLGQTPTSSNCTPGYDSNGNLRFKTDARGTTATYAYDGLNRITGKSYSDGTPGTIYTWDQYNPIFHATNTIGRLAQQQLATNNQQDVYSYDAMGRVTQIQSCFPSECGITGHVVTAAYDLAGNMTDLIYPDNRQIHQTFDSAGRLGQPGTMAVQDAVTGQTFLESVGYLADSTPSLLTLGNGVQQTISKNNRLQVQSLTVGSPLPPFAGVPFLSHSYCRVSTDRNCTMPTGTANNGNIWGITDNLNGTRTQAFTYDGLNRISSFSLGGQLNQQYQIDSFGNMSGVVNGNPLTTFDPATNRASQPCGQFISPVSGASNPASGYDDAGNQLCDFDRYGAPRQYTYDAESRIAQISAAPAQSNSAFETYTYAADGTRLRKDNLGLGKYTEYVNFNGQTISEHDETGAWTDYISANGEKIAMVQPAKTTIHVQGVQTQAAYGNCGTPWYVSGQSSGVNGYVIQQGDVLSFDRKDIAALSGVWLGFGPGTYGAGTYSTDLTDFSPDGVWHHVSTDLSPYVNQTVTALVVGPGNPNTPVGQYDTWVQNITIQSLDGTVHPVFTGGAASGSAWGPCNPVQSLAAESTPVDAVDGTTFYLHDHLGSAQMEFSASGTPLSMTQFMPFGGEINPELTENHYKFTGKERDAESGLDYFGARYMSSNMGRFMSPDWSAKIEPVPYSKLDNPQSLNLYSYVLNNPLSNVDPDGHACGGLYMNGDSGFCQRATEYGQIDAKPGVQSQTRFFAAANAVSQSLADLATPLSGLFVSGKTSSFLEGVGQNLERLNQTEAAAIQNGSLSGPNLDGQLVHNEQTSVQSQLNSFQQSDPTGYAKAISEINGSLNSPLTQNLEKLRSTDSAYAGVLAGVRKDLGRNIDFSNQGDREAIGNALIKHIRQTGGCDVNGKKQAGC